MNTRKLLLLLYEFKLMNMNPKETQITLSPEALAYQKNMSNPLYFWFGMLLKLPSAVFGDLGLKNWMWKNA